MPRLEKCEMQALSNLQQLQDIQCGLPPTMCQLTLGCVESGSVYVPLHERHDSLVQVELALELHLFSSRRVSLARKSIASSHLATAPVPLPFPLAWHSTRLVLPHSLCRYYLDSPPPPSQFEARVDEHHSPVLLLRLFTHELVSPYSSRQTCTFTTLHCIYALDLLEQLESQLTG
jgi:hypothetical protein